MKLKKINLTIFVTVIFSSLMITENKILAGSGAGWGVAGGLIGASIIANSANNRNREVVYVNNDSRHLSHREQRRLNEEQAELNRQRAELNRERERLNSEAARLGYRN